jgi:2-amino-4-hydroxy-6-hydroxymethyldihydropteridine diphosphokinase
MSPRRFLSLGSNINPESHLPACIEALKKKFPVCGVSSLYETDPVGNAGDSKFWNAVVEIESALGLEALTGELREIETALGRRRDPSNKFAPRTIDIDILPQPGYQDQGFIIVPLTEIAPDEKDPVTGKTYFELSEKFSEEKKKYRRMKL